MRPVDSGGSQDEFHRRLQELYRRLEELYRRLEELYRMKSFTVG